MTFWKIDFLNINHLLRWPWVRQINTGCWAALALSRTTDARVGQPQPTPAPWQPSHTWPWPLVLALGSPQHPHMQEKVMWRVAWTPRGPWIVAKQQALREILWIFSFLCWSVRWANWDPLSRNNVLQLVCSIPGIQGTADWGVWMWQWSDHDAQSSFTKGFYYFKEVQGEVTTLMLSRTYMQAYLPHGFRYSCENHRK